MGHARRLMSNCLDFGPDISLLRILHNAGGEGVLDF